MGLRPYQSNCLEKIKYNKDQGIYRQLVAWCTGGGKTVLFAGLPDALNIKGRVLVLVHREELATQAQDKIKHWNKNRTVGIEMGGTYSSDLDQIVVASVQTIARKGSKRLEKFKPQDFEAIVIDECHHGTSDSYITVLNHFKVFDPGNKILVLGVTATPSRSDGQGLNKVFQTITDDLYSMGY